MTYADTQSALVTLEILRRETATFAQYLGVPAGFRISLYDVPMERFDELRDALGLREAEMNDGTRYAATGPSADNSIRISLASERPVATTHRFADDREVVKQHTGATHAS